MTWRITRQEKPEQHVDVLVYFAGVGFDIANYDPSDDQWITTGNGMFEVADCEPSHWMPLPEEPSNAN